MRKMRSGSDLKPSGVCQKMIVERERKKQEKRERKKRRKRKTKRKKKDKSSTSFGDEISHLFPDHLDSLRMGVGPQRPNVFQIGLCSLHRV